MVLISAYSCIHRCPFAQLFFGCDACSSAASVGRFRRLHYQNPSLEPYSRHYLSTDHLKNGFIHGMTDWQFCSRLNFFRMSYLPAVDIILILSTAVGVISIVALIFLLLGKLVMVYHAKFLSYLIDSDEFSDEQQLSYTFNNLQKLEPQMIFSSLPSVVYHPDPKILQYRCQTLTLSKERSV